MGMLAVCAAPLGFGRWNKKRKAPPINLQATGRFNWFEVKVSALSGSLGHFCGPFLGAALHLIGSDVLDVLRKAPLMAEGIGQFAVAIAPKLVVEWHVHLGARSDRAVEGSVHIFQGQEETARGLCSWRRRGGHAGELVGQHDMGVADLYFGVGQFSLTTRPSHNILGSEQRLLK